MKIGTSKGTLRKIPSCLKRGPDLVAQQHGCHGIFSECDSETRAGTTQHVHNGYSVYHDQEATYATTSCCFTSLSLGYPPISAPELLRTLQPISALPVPRALTFASLSSVSAWASSSSSCFSFYPSPASPSADLTSPRCPNSSQCRTSRLHPRP